MSSFLELYFTYLLSTHSTAWVIEGSAAWLLSSTSNPSPPNLLLDFFFQKKCVFQNESPGKPSSLSILLPTCRLCPLKYYYIDAFIFLSDGIWLVSGTAEQAIQVRRNYQSNWPPIS